MIRSEIQRSPPQNTLASNASLAVAYFTTRLEVLKHQDTIELQITTNFCMLVWSGRHVSLVFVADFSGILIRVPHHYQHKRLRAVAIEVKFSPLIQSHGNARVIYYELN